MAGFTPLRTVVGGQEESTFVPLREVRVGEAPQRNAVSAGLSSGLDQLQGLGYSAIGGAADIVKWNSARDWANEQARRNQIEAELNGRPDLERIEDQDLGSALPYAAYQIAKQVPMIGAVAGAQFIPGLGQAAAATGLTRLGALAPRVVGGGGLEAGASVAARRAALEQGKTLATGTAVGSGMGFGALYGESVEGGAPSPYTALALAPLYGAAEAVLPAAVHGALRVPTKLPGGIARRMTTAGAIGGAGETGTELFQNELEMGMRSDLTDEQKFSRRLNSAVAGGLVGGSFGSLAGIRKPMPDDPNGADLLNQTPPDQPPLMLGYTRPGTPSLQDLPIMVAPDGSAYLDPVAARVRGVPNFTEGAFSPYNAANSLTADRFLPGNVPALPFDPNVSGALHGRADPTPVAITPYGQALGSQQDSMAYGLQAAYANALGGAQPTGLAEPWTPLGVTPYNATEVTPSSMLGARGIISPNGQAFDALSGQPLDPAPALPGAINVNAWGQAGATDRQNTTLMSRPVQQFPDPQPPAPPAPPVLGLGFNPLAGVPTVFPDGSVALGSEAELRRRYQPELGDNAPERIRNEIVEGAGPQADKALAIRLAGTIVQNLGDAAALQAALAEARERLNKSQQRLDKQVTEGSNMLAPDEYQKKKSVLDAKTATLESALAVAGKRVSFLGTQPDANQTQPAGGGAAGAPDTAAARSTGPGPADTQPSVAADGPVATVADGAGVPPTGDGAAGVGAGVQPSGAGGQAGAVVTAAQPDFDAEFAAATQRLYEAQREEERLRKRQDKLDNSLETTDPKRIAHLEKVRAAGKAASEAVQVAADIVRKRDAARAAQAPASAAPSAMAAMATTLGSGQTTAVPGSAVQATKVKGKGNEDGDRANIEVLRRQLALYNSAPAGEGVVAQRQHTNTIRNAVAHIYDTANDAEETPAVRAEAQRLLDEEVDPTDTTRLEHERATKRLLRWDNVIDVEARVIDEPLHRNVLALPDARRERLEKHYGAKADMPAFMERVKADIVKFALKGAAAVDAAIRDIIKTLHAGMLSIAVIFNPMNISAPAPVIIDETVLTETRNIRATVPADAADLMSESAKESYSVLYPSIKDQLIAQDKLMVLMDKPSARMFVFNPDGSLLLQKKVLVGKAEGDLYKGNNDLPQNRITPAGLFKMGLRDAARGGGEAKTAGEYDFGKVFVLDKAINGEYSVTLFHSVWTRDNDAQQRLDALKNNNPADSRYSFGCINVDKDTYGRLVKNHLGQMDGAALFIVPDNPAATAEFLTGATAQNKSGADALTRQTFTPKTETTTTVIRTPRQNASGETMASAQEGAEDRRKSATQVAQLDSGDSAARWRIRSGPAPTTQVDFDSAKQTADKILNALGLGGKVRFEFARNPEEIGLVSPDGPKPSGVVLSDGRTVLFTDGLGSDLDVLRAVFHELFHLGLSKTLSQGAYFKTMMGFLRDATVRQYAEKWKASDEGTQRKAEMSQSGWQALAVEEALADISEDIGANKIGSKPMNEFVRTVLRVIADFAARIGLAGAARALRRMTFTEAEKFVSDMVSRADSSAPNTLNAQRYRLRSPSRAAVNQAPSGVKDALTWVADNFSDVVKSLGLSLGTTRGLLNDAMKLMPSAKRYAALMDRASTEKVKFEKQIDTVLQAFGKLSPEVKKAVNKFLLDNTYSRKWAYKPDWLDATVVVDSAQAVAYNKLNPDARMVVDQVYKHGFDSLRTMQRAIIDSAPSEYDADIEKARAAGDGKEAQRLEALKVKNSKELQRFKDMLNLNAYWPYAPLKRFGNWVAVGKSAEYMRQEELADNDDANAKKWLNENESNVDHYVVRFLETKNEARKAARQMQDTHGKAGADFFERLNDAQAIYGGQGVFPAFQRLRTALETADDRVDSKTSGRIRAMTQDLYLSLLSETSTRHAGRERRDIAGADGDMLRAFATQGRATAHFISSLRTTGPVTEVLMKMKKESGGNAPDRATRSQYFNEIVRRHGMGLEYNPNQLMDKALATNSLFMLTSNPSYFIVNATQPWLSSLPVLAGRFGPRAAAALAQAYSNVLPLLDRVIAGAPDDPKLKDPQREILRVLRELMDRGRIDISMDQDIGRFESITGRMAVVSTVAEKLRKVAERVELVNRATTAIAAYELAKTNKSKTAKAGVDPVDYAEEVIIDTHFDYSGFNAPRIMRTPLGRVATQFRKFQLGQLALMYKLLREAFAGASANEKAVARAALMYTLGTTFAAGGLMALPGFAAISFLVGALWPDDDEPDDPEATLRRMGKDGGLSNTMVDFLLKGAPKAGGWDLSSRVGMGGMLSLVPYADVDKFDREAYTNVLIGLVGPMLGGALPRAVDGAAALWHGDTLKGLEKLAPKGLANAIQTARLQSEGMTLKNGDVVLKPDELDFLSGALQALGFTPEKVADAYFVQGARFKADEFYSNQTSRLKLDYTKAAKANDQQAMTEIRADWTQTQDARTRLGYKRQPLSDLLKAPQVQAKRERNAVGGSEFTERNKGFVRSAAAEVE